MADQMLQSLHRETEEGRRTSLRRQQQQQEASQLQQSVALATRELGESFAQDFSQAIGSLQTEKETLSRQLKSVHGQLLEANKNISSMQQDMKCLSVSPPSFPLLYIAIYLFLSALACADRQTDRHTHTHTRTQLHRLSHMPYFPPII